MRRPPRRHRHPVPRGVPGSHPPSAIAQPAVFALQYALAQLWQSWGVEPAIVAGHSLGEYAAACVAGVFSLADGLKLAAARDRLMRSVPVAGEMVTVFADEATVSTVLAPQPDVAIAAINSPESVVISGRSEAVRSSYRRIASAQDPIAPFADRICFALAVDRTDPG